MMLMMMPMMLAVLTPLINNRHETSKHPVLVLSDLHEFRSCRVQMTNEIKCITITPKHDD